MPHPQSSGEVPVLLTQSTVYVHTCIQDSERGKFTVSEDALLAPKK